MYFGETVTLSGSRQLLYTLVTAAQNVLHASDPQYQWDATACLLQLFSDQANGSGLIYVGGSDLATSNYGYVLAAGGSRQYGPFPMNVAIGQGLYVLSSTSNLVLHVEGCLV